jgi:hypothetical protein
MVMKRIMSAVPAWLLILGVAMAMSCGCARPAAEHDEEAHAVPAHHPRTFRRAVIDIGHRGTVLTSGMLDARSRERERRQLLDIVRWLPELAADTELGRRDWELVNDAADSLARELDAFTATGRDATLSTTLDTAMKTLWAVHASLPPDTPSEEKT